MKVEFEGEPGVDEGGVQKEFFQLLIREIFDPGYGMFVHQNETRQYWIKGDSFETPMKFELIGIMLGLAIYNGVILDVHLPMACYKKLIDIEPTIDDVIQYSPSMGKSLLAILNNDSPTLKEELYMKFEV